MACCIKVVRFSRLVKGLAPRNEGNLACTNILISRCVAKRILERRTIFMQPIES